MNVVKVASRITLVCSGVFMLLMGVFNKFGAVLATVPAPLIGAQFALGMAMVIGVAFSTLQVIRFSWVSFEKFGATC